MRARMGSLIWALALLWPLGAAAQAAGCAVPDHLPPVRLIGVWTLTLWPDGASAAQASSRGALLLEQHPEYPASVRGELKRSSSGNDLLAIVSGDVTEGEFHLDESDDGQRITAVWSGTAEDCAGRIGITGVRRPATGAEPDGPVLRFRLQRTPSW